MADNVVFVALAPAWFVQARQQDMRRAGFALVALCELPSRQIGPSSAPS